jgi:hypothetical protein
MQLNAKGFILNCTLKPTFKNSFQQPMLFLIFDNKKSIENITNYGFQKIKENSIGIDIQMFLFKDLIFNKVPSVSTDSSY